MEILRIHKDSLMNVLEAYVHDPLVEWEDERMKRVRLLLVIDLRSATHLLSAFNM